MSGMGLPTLLLAVQLVVGLLAAGDLLRSLWHRHVGLFTVGQVIAALVLTALGADGLFIGSDVAGWVSYDLNIEPVWVRPATIGLIVLGALLWGTERPRPTPSSQ